MITRMVSCTVLVALAAGSVQPVIAKDPPSTSAETEAAQALVRAALEAEINDDAALRDSFLKRALDKAPDFAPARWHSGYVREGNEWLRYDEVWQRATSNKRLKLYQQMRNRANSSDDHLTLARWCRRTGLGERAQLHWMYVLAQNPNNEDARRALRVRDFRGMLLTEEEIAEFERQQQEAEVVNSRWKSRLQPLKKAILSDDTAAQEDALAELHKVHDPEAIPVLVNLLATENEQLALEVVAVLGKMSEPSSTSALTALALFAPHNTVRIAAARQLRQRPLHEFVPAMLANLRTPLEFRYYQQDLLRGPVFSYTIEQDGPQTELLSTTQVSRLFPNPYLWARTLRQGMDRIATAQREVVLKNQRAERMNQRAFAALKEATQQDLKDEPRAWWNWWIEWNEFYAYKWKVSTRHFSWLLSCFVAGTTVLTETGPRPIETIRIGDRVLSQDCETGELAYKIVMQTTLRPPSKTLRVEIAGEEIWTTLGHPFWATDQGWRMAKQLEQGSLLHAVTGPQLVDAINQGPEVSAHNLVVADFKTYFVGQSKVLVHDNQPRNPTRVKLPGMAAK